jgi:hypothetical protein
MERGQREQYVLPQLQPRQRQRLIAAEEVPSVPPRRTEKNNMVSDSCFLVPGGGSPPVLAISSITLSGPRTSGKNEPRNAACTIVQLVVQLTQKQKESVAQFRIRTRDPSSCNLIAHCSHAGPSMFGRVIRCAGCGQNHSIYIVRSASSTLELLCHTNRPNLPDPRCSAAWCVLSPTGSSYQ